mmetsp:Transcript_4096/g.25789  ORF Transcript_4096/g.25789 Transcript_4096/m.25789 type:complete len:226 (+) Transcript_4096:3017-3694(+)
MAVHRVVTHIGLRTSEPGDVHVPFFHVKVVVWSHLVPLLVPVEIFGYVGPESSWILDRSAVHLFVLLLAFHVRLFGERWRRWIRRTVHVGVSFVFGVVGEGKRLVQRTQPRQTRSGPKRAPPRTLAGEIRTCKRRTMRLRAHPVVGEARAAWRWTTCRARQCRCTPVDADAPRGASLATGGEARCTPVGREDTPRWEGLAFTTESKLAWHQRPWTLEACVATVST